MNKYTFLFLFVLSISFGCSKDEELLTDCVESMIENNAMEAYSEQEIGCRFFLELYHYQNQEYFLLGSHCADIESLPIDCGTDILCDSLDDAICIDFFEKAIYKGIVGVRK